MHDRQKPADLLEWYDIHARTLPWRISPEDRKAGVLPDPYRIWLSEVMLQQTTVAAVKTYFLRFTHLWPTIADLAAAPDEQVMGEWAGLGYYARARNLLKCARQVSTQFNGQFPDNKDTLLSLPGIGPYTAAAITAIAFDRPETVVDGNVERVIARTHNIHTPLPAAKPELTAAATALTPKDRAGDYAQAIMDLGATICTPRSPTCGICPWQKICKSSAAGVHENLPAKTPKKPKPTRHGIVYVTRRSDAAWLLETRPAKGLLGGMLCWPGSDWNDAPAPFPPVEATWQALPEEVRHTFTHFHLKLKVYVTTVTHNAQVHRGEFIPHTNFNPAKLPTVMRKAFDLAHDSLQ